MWIVELHVLNNSKNQIGFIAGACALVLSGALAHAQTAAAPATSAPATSAAAPSTSSASTPSSGGASTELPRVNVIGTKPTEKPIPGGSAMPIRDAVVNAYLKIHREPIKEPVTQTGCKGAMAPGKPYFVEFRSRGAQSFGHTFVFYGRLGPGNRFASFSVAGLHPAGEDPATYMQGLWAPVPAETGVSWGDLDEQYLTARFCVTLTEAEYKKTVAYIRELQATKKTWHGTTYNCNSFGADIAKFVGLDSPNPNMYLPDKFINRLAESNPRGKKAEGSTAFSSWAQPPAFGGQSAKQR